MTEPARVFICYAREDQHAARRLFKDLRKAGLNPWLDAESLLPGQRWEVTIRQAIRESSYFLALLSSKSVEKRSFLQKEIREALDISDEFPEKCIFLIPVRLDDCEPPYQKLREFQWVDMFPDWDDGMNRLLTAIETDKETSIMKSKLTGAVLKDLNREILDFLGEEEEKKSPTRAYLSILRTDGGGIEISVDFLNGTIPVLKSSVFIDTSDKVEKLSRQFMYIGRILSKYFSFQYPNGKQSNEFLAILKRKGRELLECLGSEDIIEKLNVSHVILETNMDDIPFELMWADNFFSLKYAIGRRLRIKEQVISRSHRSIGIPRALVIADPTSDLKEAIDECNYIKAKLSKFIDIDYLTRTKTTCNHVLTLLQSGYTIIHYAGHIDENGLKLSDGYLYSNVIRENLKGNPIVFMNGCRSATRTNPRLAEAFLCGGAIGYIGSLWWISDKPAAELAIDFYRNVLDCYTLGESLMMAKEKAFHKGSLGWACYILFGDPALRLVKG